MDKIDGFNGTFLAVSLCAGFALTSGVLAADDKTDPVTAMIKLLDTNHDGKISVTELAAGAKVRFDAMDVDHNGRVTTAEMDASNKAGTKGAYTAQSVSSATRIKAMDSNNDGMLTADEYAAYAKAQFDAMDSNHDDQLSEDELRIGYDSEKKAGITLLGL
jgi:Ca2+-binding EF-hand superfamily protein